VVTCITGTLTRPIAINGHNASRELVEDLRSGRFGLAFAVGSRDARAAERVVRQAALEAGRAGTEARLGGPGAGGLNATGPAAFARVAFGLLATLDRVRIVRAVAGLIGTACSRAVSGLDAHAGDVIIVARVTDGGPGCGCQSGYKEKNRAHVLHLLKRWRL